MLSNIFNLAKYTRHKSEGVSTHQKSAQQQNHEDFSIIIAYTFCRDLPKGVSVSNLDVVHVCPTSSPEVLAKVHTLGEPLSSRSDTSASLSIT